MVVLLKRVLWNDSDSNQKRCYPLIDRAIGSNTVFSVFPSLRRGLFFTLVRAKARMKFACAGNPDYGFITDFNAGNVDEVARRNLRCDISVFVTMLICCLPIPFMDRCARIYEKGEGS